MRVIAGTARSLRLKTPEGMDTRPTTDRIKETLFNMLQPYLGDALFVDLFSGKKGSLLHTGESTVYPSCRTGDRFKDGCAFCAL